MSSKHASGSLRNLLRSLRAAHRRNSDEWTRRIEVPAQRPPTWPV
jgi:hypothetical protein